MSIVRGPRLEDNFTIVSHDLSRDSRLTRRARGLLIEILSYPVDWRTDYKALARGGPEGESAIRAALAELRTYGYIVQTRTQGSDGRWSTTNTVYAQPQANPQVTPSVGKPKPGQPKPGAPTPIRSTHTKDLEEVSELHSLAADAARPHEDPPIPERDTDDTGPTFGDWRPEDRQRFAEIIGTTHIESDGTGPWNAGRWDVTEWYGAFRKRKKNPMNWPGQYFEKLDGDRAVEEYLASLGLEPVDDEAREDPWATSA